MAIAADESMVLEIGIVKVDGSGSMKTTSNHAMAFKLGKTSNHVGMDFAVLEFEIDKELVDEPLLIYFRGVNATHDEDLYEPELCSELFIEIEFRAIQNLHACESNHPELTTVKEPITLS